MIYKALSALLFTSILTFSQAQVVLDNFNFGTTTGSETAGTSWVGQTTQNTGTVTVAGTAVNENGWSWTAGSAAEYINGSTFDQVTITAILDASNAASDFAIEFRAIDGGVVSQSFSTPMTNFTAGVTSTGTIPVAWTINPAQIFSWNIGGGNPAPGGGSPVFRMSLDNLALTASAVPEPSAYALLAGVACLGFMITRRRRYAQN